METLIPRLVKVCSRCKTPKPHSAFYPERRPQQAKDGLRSACRECEDTAKRQWQAAHPEIVRARAAKYAAVNAAQIKARQRARYARDKEKILARNKAWRQNNRETWKAGRAAYHRRNPHVMLNSRRRKLYGVSPEDVQRMITAQGGRCLGCDGVLSNLKPCVDHDHKTGKIRGILCHSCNSGLGLLKDNIATLRRLTRYLDSHSPHAARPLLNYLD